jgi:hypothetical protein
MEAHFVTGEGLALEDLSTTTRIDFSALRTPQVAALQFALVTANKPIARIEANALNDRGVAHHVLW